MKSESLLLLRAIEATARGDGTSAIRAFRGLVRRFPFRIDYLVALAELLYQEELYGPAIATWRRALALLERGEAQCPPGYPDQKRLEAGRIHFQMGGALAAAGDPAEAESCLRHAVALDPCARHLVGLGSQLELTGGRAEALSLYERAVGEAPTFAEGHYRLASMYVWTDPARAESGLRRVLELDDSHAMALSMLGLLLGTREAWHEAAHCLERAIRLGGAGALPFVYRGHHAWQRGRLRKAEAAYRAGMRADPGDPHPLFALGDLFHHEDRSADARQAYEESLRLDPGCGDAALRLGHLADDEDRLEDAIRYFRQGLELAPEHPWERDVRERLEELEGGG